MRSLPYIDDLGDPFSCASCGEIDSRTCLCGVAVGQPVQDAEGGLADRDLLAPVSAPFHTEPTSPEASRNHG